MDENPDSLSNDRESRAILSRAICTAERVIQLLKVEHELWLSGRCSVLRAYALSVATAIIQLKELAETTDAVGFDLSLELVGFLAEELKSVMYELFNA